METSMYKKTNKFDKDIPPKIPDEVFKQMMIWYCRDEKGNRVVYSPEKVKRAEMLVKSYWEMENERVD